MRSTSSSTPQILRSKSDRFPISRSSERFTDQIFLYFIDRILLDRSPSYTQTSRTAPRFGYYRRTKIDATQKDRSAYSCSVTITQTLCGTNRISLLPPEFKKTHHELQLHHCLRLNRSRPSRWNSFTVVCCFNLGRNRSNLWILAYAGASLALLVIQTLANFFILPDLALRSENGADIFRISAIFFSVLWGFVTLILIGAVLARPKG